jgi:hypothetical protein
MNKMFHDYVVKKPLQCFSDWLVVCCQLPIIEVDKYILIQISKTSLISQLANEPYKCRISWLILWRTRR